jgi:hypothetical protein
MEITSTQVSGATRSRKPVSVRLRTAFLLGLLTMAGVSASATIYPAIASSNNDPSTAKKSPRKLYPIVQNRRFGFIDETGQIVIAPRFLWASPFSEGLAAVFICHKYGYIDQTGRLVIPPRFDDAAEFSDGLASVMIGGKIGYIDGTGRIQIPPRYDNAQAFEDGLAAVQIGAHWGFIDKSGRLAVPAQFDELLGFSDGLSGALIGDRWGFVDKTGKIVIPIRYKNVGWFLDRRASVTTEAGVDEFIDPSGRVAIPDAFGVWGFSEGLAPIEVNDSYRFVDADGQVVIPGPFDSVEGFSEGLAPVERGDKWVTSTNVVTLLFRCNLTVHIHFKTAWPTFASATKKVISTGPAR